MMGLCKNRSVSYHVRYVFFNRVPYLERLWGMKARFDGIQTALLAAELLFDGTG